LGEQKGAPAPNKSNRNRKITSLRSWMVQWYKTYCFPSLSQASRLCSITTINWNKPTCFIFIETYCIVSFLL